jgi:hypothetical protein
VFTFVGVRDNKNLGSRRDVCAAAVTPFKSTIIALGPPVLLSVCMAMFNMDVGLI